ncbi:MAG: hypothetical protein MHM6MM_004987 [Cercozoa sp. M6MM]
MGCMHCTTTTWLASRHCQVLPVCPEFSSQLLSLAVPDHCMLGVFAHLIPACVLQEEKDILTPSETEQVFGLLECIFEN